MTTIKITTTTTEDHEQLIPDPRAGVRPRELVDKKLRERLKVLPISKTTRDSQRK